jgi:methylenetetrahydromethanopterin dehydrogenase
MAQAAARLAEEAREIEKSNDTLTRRSHSRKGILKVKTKLMLPPTTDDAACKESTKK